MHTTQEPEAYTMYAYSELEPHEDPVLNTAGHVVAPLTRCDDVHLNVAQDTPGRSGPGNAHYAMHSQQTDIAQCTQ